MEPEPNGGRDHTEEESASADGAASGEEAASVEAPHAESEPDGGGDRSQEEPVLAEGVVPPGADDATADAKADVDRGGSDEGDLPLTSASGGTSNADFFEAADEDRSLSADDSPSEGKVAETRVDAGDRAETPTRRRRVGRGRLSSGAIGLVVLVVLAVLCAGLIVAVVVKSRNDAETAAREAASYTPPPLRASAPPTGVIGSIAVIGDESARSGASGVAAAQRWPRLLSGAFGADLEVTASAGAGYASEGDSGGTFVDAATTVPVDAGLVLFVGGAADGADTSLALARAATEAYSAATQRAPDATVIAVGPLFRPAGTAVDEFDQVRTTLRSAARIAGVRWVDPVAAGWLPGVDGTGDLSEGDQRVIAERLQGLVVDDE
ncbi:hypothetical protein [Amnibacterium endophyticum]|uniref:SGNH hydrolase-type esterase domain-containing protein n=1 Tax=Amnibacterium endophyticum TaxID=2109337 RepID=A0ABW4LCS8_9MICO